ncbi:MAG: LD-carboxypeptidase [Salinivirgaceae bacterium]|nr:LD-carboxypeptidase [Salinivirgaceae bacterium]
MITPPPLQKGDSVGIVAPARFVGQENYAGICSTIESYGYNPVRGLTTHLEHGIFAGTDDERSADLQQMIDNPEIRAIFCVRGGYGCVRMVDKVDFSGLLQSPKWIVGFSDITVLHAALSNLGIESVHGQMPVNFCKPMSSVNELFNVLEGGRPNYVFNGDGNRPGEAYSEVCGGNLSILCSLMGTPWQLDTNGKILFIEDVCEPLYRIDRMMQQLKAAGVLANLAGLVCGYFTDAEDSTPSFGLTANQIVMDAVSEYDYPVAFGFHAGHEQPNNPLIFGGEAHLSVNKSVSNLIFNNERA